MNFMKNTALSLVLTTAMASASVVRAGDDCDAKRIDAISFMPAIAFSSDVKSDFVLAEKRMKIAEERLLIPTNGWRLDEAFTFDGETEGVIDPGLSLEYRDIGSTKLCGGNNWKRGELYLCFTDTDGDGTYDAGEIEKGKFFGSSDNTFPLKDGVKMTRWSDYLATAKAVEQLPVGLPVLGKALVVRKVKKDYIELAVAVGGAFKEVVKEKNKHKDDGLDIWYATTVAKERFPLGDLAPIQFGGFNIRFSRNEKGDLLIAAEGEFAGLDPVYKCDNTRVEIDEMTLTRQEDIFQVRMGSIVASMRY